MSNHAASLKANPPSSPHRAVTPAPGSRPRLPSVRRGSVRALLFLCAGAAVAAALLPAAAFAQKRTAVAGVHVIDLEDGAIADDQTLLIRDGFIEGIFRTVLASVPPSYEVVPGDGLYVLPPLVDVSLYHDLAPTGSGGSEGRTASEEISADLARHGILCTLVPGPGADSSEAEAAKLHCYPTGPLFEPSPGFAPAWNTHPHLVFLEDRVPLESQLREIMPVNAPLAVMGIRIPASLALRLAQAAARQELGTLMPASTLRSGTEGILRSGVQVVESLGLAALGFAYPEGMAVLFQDGPPSFDEEPTASHLAALALERIPIGVLDSLAAATPDVEKLLTGLASTPVLCPELWVFESELSRRGYAGALPDSLRALLRRLQTAGVPLVVGTGGGGGEAYHREIDLWRRAGIPPHEILRAACVTGGALLGRPGVARLKAGLPADLVFVEGNPLVDLKALRDVRLVVKDGVLHR